MADGRPLPPLLHRPHPVPEQRRLLKAQLLRGGQHLRLQALQELLRAAGQQLGELALIYEGKTLGVVPILAVSEVAASQSKVFMHNLKLFFQNIRDYGVTSIYLPPAGVHYILTLAGRELAKYDQQLDFLYSSSSALPGGDKEKLIKLLPNVRKFDAYGGSEVGAVCYIDYNAVRDNTKCVGKANPGVDIYIVDEHYQPMEATAENPGIIAIRSNTVTAGYWNEPEMTANTIRDGVIYMTDLGYIENGYLYLVGRRDDVINVGGLKIAPTEVEDVVLRHSMVDECVCIPYEDRVYGRVVKMLVKVSQGQTLDAGVLAAYLDEKLEAYKIPKYIEAVEEIPRTFNGKIDRKKIIAQYNG